MGILSTLFEKDIPQQSHAVEFIKEELSLIKNVPVMPGDQFSQHARKQSIYEQSSMYIQGIAAHFISAKNYLLAEKLATLSESVAQNAIERHYCYNLWIDLLYKALALSYPFIAKHENYQKRLDKVKAKI